MIFSVLVSTIIFPVVGKLCDTFQPRNILPFSFMLRCLSTILFWMLDTPDSYYAYGVCVLMVIASIVNNISTDTIYYKNLQKETRGILNGAYSFAGQFGILIYSLIAGYIFDIIGPKSPFILLGIMDLSFVLIYIAFCITESRNQNKKVHSNSSIKV